MRKKYYIDYPEFFPAMKKRISFDMALFTKSIEIINIEKHEKTMEEIKKKTGIDPMDKITDGIVDKSKHIACLNWEKKGRIYLGNGSYKISRKPNK